MKWLWIIGGYFVFSEVLYSIIYINHKEEQTTGSRLWFILIWTLLWVGLCANIAFAELDYFQVKDEKIVNAIYWAEGGPKAKVPYGILSVKTDDPRKVCMNTVRNNKERFLAQNEYKDYIEFLGSRYAPVGADNDPKGLNKVWVDNVKWYINHPKKI